MFSIFSQFLIPYAPKMECGDSTCAAAADNTFNFTFYPGRLGGAIGNQEAAILAMKPLSLPIYNFFNL
jgi:hypothetical protein